MLPGRFWRPWTVTVVGTVQFLPHKPSLWVGGVAEWLFARVISLTHSPAYQSTSCTKRSNKSTGASREVRPGLSMCLYHGCTDTCPVLCSALAMTQNAREGGDLIQATEPEQFPLQCIVRHCVLLLHFHFKSPGEEHEQFTENRSTRPSHSGSTWRRVSRFSMQCLLSLKFHIPPSVLNQQ